MTETAETLATPGWNRDPWAVDALAVAGTVGVFGLLGNLPGVTLALALGVGLFVLPGILVIALAQVALAVLLPKDPALATILLGELPLVALLGADIDWDHSREQIGTVLLFSGTVLAASVAATAVAPRLSIAALAVLGITALFVYGGHRYAAVRYETQPASQIGNESGPPDGTEASTETTVQARTGASDETPPESAP